MKPGYVVLIIVFVSGIVAIGFYMMKRLDNFLAESQKKIKAKDAEKPHDGLRIAFENPVILLRNTWRCCPKHIRTAYYILLSALQNRYSVPSTQTALTSDLFFLQ